MRGNDMSIFLKGSAKLVKSKFHECSRMAGTFDMPTVIESYGQPFSKLVRYSEDHDIGIEEKVDEILAILKERK